MFELVAMIVDCWSAQSLPCNHPHLCSFVANLKKSTIGVEFGTTGEIYRDGEGKAVVAIPRDLEIALIVGLVSAV